MAESSALFLQFFLGDEPYVLPASSVRSIVPAVRCRPIDGAPEYVVGLMDYRGQPVPVIDLCRLCLQRAARELYSSRIVLVDYPTARGSVLLGLLAENVLELMRCEPSKFRPIPLSLPESRLSASVAPLENQLVAQVQVSQLLSPEVRDLLFPQESSLRG